MGTKELAKKLFGGMLTAKQDEQLASKSPTRRTIKLARVQIINDPNRKQVQRMSYEELMDDILNPLQNGEFKGMKMKGESKFAQPDATTKRKCVEQLDSDYKREVMEVLTDRSETVEALVALADKKKKSLERLPISEYEKYCQSMKFQNNF